MPYIKQEDRESVKNSQPKNVGSLNYVITTLCKEYLEKNGESYGTYNDLIGVLECAKLELYRRKIAFYEDKKIIDNGDVWD